MKDILKLGDLDTERLHWVDVREMYGSVAPRRQIVALGCFCPLCACTRPDERKWIWLQAIVRWFSKQQAWQSGRVKIGGQNHRWVSLSVAT